MINEIKPSKKFPSYLKKIESGGLLIGFIYVLVFMSILALIISQITQSTNLNNTLSTIDERVLIIEVYLIWGLLRQSNLIRPS